MKFLDKIFHLTENNTSIKKELIGGAITFISMCYILPVNSSILSDMGMDRGGVFAITALLSCIISLIMAFVANYPIALSAGMGLNAFVAYSLTDAMGFTNWQQKMVLLFISGILFFFFSFTPIRKKLIEVIPANLRSVIAACLGAFIIFVGLNKSGIIASDPTTYVTLGNFADPAIIIGLICIFGTIGLMFVKNKTITNLAVPIGILVSAVIGLITSSIMIAGGAIKEVGGTYVYDFANLSGVPTNLPIAPWISKPSWGIDVNGIKNVFFFGVFSDSYSFEKLGEDLGHIFTEPATYLAIFSLIFVTLFNTTATLIAVGENAGLFNEKGEMKNYKRVIIADATGALVCAPLGTTTIMPFAESNTGVSLGAKTGLSVTLASFLFLLSAFVYPLFSIFTAPSIYAIALVSIGLIIMISSLRNIDFKENIVIAVTTIVGILFTILTYSISNGIGFSIIAFVLMNLFTGKAKENTTPLYVISAAFIISFALTAILPLLKG